MPMMNKPLRISHAVIKKLFCPVVSKEPKIAFMRKKLKKMIKMLPNPAKII